jgi:hypothetical protein
MNSKKLLAILLSVTAMLFLSVLTTTQAQAQQQPPTLFTTVTEGNLFPGGIVSFGVSSGPGTVTIDHVNAGTGLQSLTVVGTPTNAVVNIPAFVPGTFAPVVVTITIPNSDLGCDFILRAASTFHAANIRVRCPPRCPTFTPSPTPILIPGVITSGLQGTIGKASPYPSNIVVSGLGGIVQQVRVTLHNFRHDRPDDVTILLTGPSGKIILMSDVGGDFPVSPPVTLTFRDTGVPFLPDNGPLVSGTFRPTNWEDGDTFPFPAPPAPYGSKLSDFNGIIPNGTWQLFVIDDRTGFNGRMDGWTLSIDTTTTTCSP